MNIRSASYASDSYMGKSVRSSLTESISSLNTNTSFTQSNRYFSIEHDLLLESFSEYCQQIQENAYVNIRETCEIMRKYKILKQFKENIDIQWEKIRKNIVEYLKINKNIVQTYSDWKSKFLECQDKIQECKSMEQLKKTVSFLQSSERIKLNRQKKCIFNEDQEEMNEKMKNWRQFGKQIQISGQVIKDYSIKIIELVTEKSENEKKFEQKSERKAITKNYFELREQIMEEIMKKQIKIQVNKNNQRVPLKGALSDRNKNQQRQGQKRQLKREQCQCKKIIQKSNMWIQKILNLYSDQE